MQVIMIQCDNPKCKQQGVPEWVDPKGKKPPTGPYGWLEVTANYIGCGPAVCVTVCKDACLMPALEHEVEEALRRERGE